MTRALLHLLLASVAMTPAGAAETPLSVKSSFRLGDAGVLCTAQVRPTDQRLSGMFDRSYLLTCRDAAAPVGSVIAVRRPVDLARRAERLAAGSLACRAEEVGDDRQSGRSAGTSLPRRGGGDRLPALCRTARQDHIPGRGPGRI